MHTPPIFWYIGIFELANGGDHQWAYNVQFTSDVPEAETVVVTMDGEVLVPVKQPRRQH